MNRKMLEALISVLTLLFLSTTLALSTQTNSVYAQGAPYVVFDDEGTAFWVAYSGGGNGSLAARIANETSFVNSGSSSIKATITSGSYRNAGIYHRYSPMTDWSAYNTISFWMKGSNSGYYVTFAIMAPTGNNMITLIHDNFTVWQSYTFNLNENLNQEGHIYKTGSPNMSRIEMIEFSFNSSATVYIDRVVVSYVSSNAPTPAPTHTAAPTVGPSQTTTPKPTQTPITSPYPTVSPSPNEPNGGDGNIATFLTANWPWLFVYVIVIITVALLLWKTKTKNTSS